MRPLFYLYFSLFFLGFSLPSCIDSQPQDPESLAQFYWESLQKEEFSPLLQYWTDIREINELVELFPVLEKDLPKGSKSSEMLVRQSEKQSFEMILALIKKRQLNLEDGKILKTRFRSVNKLRGREIGEQRFTIEFPTQRLNLRLVFFNTGRQWKYLGLFYYSFKENASQDEIRET